MPNKSPKKTFYCFNEQYSTSASVLSCYTSWFYSHHSICMYIYLYLEGNKDISFWIGCCLYVVNTFRTKINNIVLDKFELNTAMVYALLHWSKKEF